MHTFTFFASGYSNFNFFENLLHLDDLHQTPVSSPISGPGILSYKYRLEEQYEENGQKLYVNRGLGFLGYPGRVGISPEITLFELQS